MSSRHAAFHEGGGVEVGRVVAVLPQLPAAQQNEGGRGALRHVRRDGNDIHSRGTSGMHSRFQPMWSQKVCVQTNPY
jgi:hypothetical protein